MPKTKKITSPALLDKLSRHEYFEETDTHAHATTHHFNREFQHNKDTVITIRFIFFMRVFVKNKEPIRGKN